MADNEPGSDREILLLEYDPELARAMGEERRALARGAATTTMVSVPRGPWGVRELCKERKCSYGLLLLDGLVSRTVSVDHVRAVELFGRGDLIPAAVEHEEPFVAAAFHWSVVDAASVALLDESFMAAMTPWPEIVAALLLRVAAQSDRGAIHCALCQLPRVEDRLHGMLWLLAERWGRITPHGVMLRLRLTHELLGHFIGAKRPTVTLAIKELEGRGVVRRRSDGAWLLHAPWAPAREGGSDLAEISRPAVDDLLRPGARAAAAGR